MWIACALTLSFLVLRAASVRPEAMTRAVEQFEETTDLWNGLLHADYLPGYHNAFTNTPPTNGWLDFLRADGENVVQLS